MAKKPREDNIGNFNASGGTADEDELRDHVAPIPIPSELTGNAEQSEAERYASGIINGPAPLNDITTEAKKP